MIVFTENVKPLYFAYNNSVVRFNTDSLLPVANCEITGLSVPIKLYPMNGFYFNFKEYLSVLANNNNFFDLINPNLVNTYIYNCQTYFEISVTFKINFVNTTFETVTKNIVFIAGVEQLENFKKNEVYLNQNTFCLLPITPETNNTNYIKYWQGYPFDISVIEKTNSILKLTNESNLIDFDFLITQKSNRLFFCDGSNDNIINDIVPLTQGVNKCTINNSNLIIDFEPNPCGGIYLKWLNNYGGYSYWLFSDYYQKNNQYKNIGELKRDFENLENTFAPTTQLGKKTNQSIDFVVDNINEMELSVIETLLESPKVFLYKGQPFSRGAAKDWIEVRVDTSKATIRNFKGQPVKIGFSLELPEKENITL